MGFWLFLMYAVVILLLPPGLYYALKGEAKRKQQQYMKIMESQDEEECLAAVRDMIAPLRRAERGPFAGKGVDGLSGEECARLLHYHYLPLMEKRVSISRRLIPITLMTFPLIFLPSLVRAFSLTRLSVVLLFSAFTIAYLWFSISRIVYPWNEKHLEMMREIDRHVFPLLGGSGTVQG